MRLRFCSVLLVLACAACGGGSADTTDPGGGGPSGDGVASVVLTVRGTAANERDMIVRYVIADAATTRAAAAAMTPTPFGCFGDVSPTCTINVPVGKTITFFAIEGEGVVNADAGPQRPVPAPDPRRHEFISFNGDCNVNVVLGDCALRISADRDYAVRADFSVMPSAVFAMAGAGGLRYTWAVRDRIAFPNRPYVINPPVTPAGGIHVPGAPLVYGFLPTGSSITATRQVTSGGHSNFIQWTGPCTSGGGVTGSCTQILGATPPPTSTAVFEYFDCGNNQFTDGGTGATPPAGCTRMRPP
jgi:hypothetical protein